MVVILPVVALLVALWDPFRNGFKRNSMTLVNFSLNVVYLSLVRTLLVAG